jgi:hypothetical protein
VDSEWVVTLVSVGVLLVGVAGSMARAARRGAEWQSRVEGDWRRTAEEIGARIEVTGSGALAPRRLVLSQTLEEAQVFADTNVPVDPGAPAHTRARARFVLGHGPAFSAIDRRSVTDPAGLEREIFADDRALAHRVQLRTSTPHAVRSLFTEQARTLVRNFARAFALRSEGTRLELVWDGVEVNGSVLADALALVGELARSGVAPLRALTAIDGAIYAEGRVSVHRGDIEVCFFAREGERGPIYAARVDAHRALPDLRVHIDDAGVIDGAIPAGTIDPDSAQALPSLGACTLRAANDVELVWDGAPSVAAAEAAVCVLVALATGGTRKGAFR